MNALPNPVLLSCLEAEPDFEPIPDWALDTIGGALSDGLINQITEPAIMQAFVGHQELTKFLEWASRIGAITARCSGPIAEITAFALDASKTLEVVRKVKGVTSDKEAAELENELRKNLGELIKELGSPEPSFNEEGILTWDGILADRLASISVKGKTLAKSVRTNATKRKEQWNIDHKAQGLWKIWVPEGYVFLLAQSLWPVVQARIEREGKKHVALVRPVFAELTEVMRSPYKAEDQNGQRVLCFKGEPIEIAQVDQGILELIDKGFEKLGTIVSHRVIREIVFSGYGKQMMGQTEVTLNYPGGMQTFCSAAGCNSAADSPVARQILHALAYLPFKLPNNFKGNLIALQEQRAGNGRQGMIVITPGPPLLANYVFGQTGEDKLIGKDRFLVPLLPIPPLIGRANNHAQQVVLSQYAVLEMRDRAREMAKDGAIRITQERWVELAIKARMPRDAGLLTQVVDRWAQDGDDGPALLSREKDMFTLSSTHEAARNYIIKGGMISNRASVRSNKGKAKREASLEEKTPKKRVTKVGF